MTIPTKKPAHPLVGAAAHSLDEHGTTKYQIRVLEVFPSGSPEAGDLALVQFYSWIVGEATNRRLIPLKELATPGWKFFADLEDANDYYEHVARHRDEHIRRGLTQKGTAP
jgi:hypothetical protein